MSQSSGDSDESDEQRFSDLDQMDNNSESDVEMSKNQVKKPQFDNPEEEDAYNLYCAQNGQIKQ